MTTVIFTMTHKKFNQPADDIYIPLHVGRAASGDLGYMGDDTGVSISQKNCFYGELTGLYWLWKNYQTDGNIGICHYRRFFIDNSRMLLKEEDYNRILEEYDVITSEAMYVETDTYQEFYGEAHNVKDILLEGEVIRELYPADYPAFEQVMQGKKHYFGNLMVTSKKLFDEYCAWLFSIFDVLEPRIDVSTYDEYHRRVFGFLSEQLLLVWITARGLRVYECEVGLTGEKAETTEFKMAIGKLLKQGMVSEARGLFYGIMKVRPDIRLEHSDLKGEIPLIEHLLYIGEMEKNNGVKGLLAYRDNLPELITHYLQVKQILEKVPSWEQADIDYLKNTNVTRYAVAVIVKNQASLIPREKQVMDFCEEKIWED